MLTSVISTIPCVSNLAKKASQAETGSPEAEEKDNTRDLGNPDKGSLPAKLETAEFSAVEIWALADCLFNFAKLQTA